MASHFGLPVLPAEIGKIINNLNVQKRLPKLTTGFDSSHGPYRWRLHLDVASLLQCL